MGFELPAVAIRTEIRAGDVDTVVRMHGTIYTREYGFDRTFETYVALPLSEFARGGSPRERMWIAERGDAFAGCVAIVTATEDIAQLRWFLVIPDARGRGLGSTLMRAAVAFAREQGYASIVLWTVSALTAAAHLYRAAGFELVEERPGRHWGVSVVETNYELRLGPPKLP